MSYSSFLGSSRDLFISCCNKTHRIAQDAGGWRIVWLILFAALYYNFYGSSGLYLRGEGGTIAVYAQRILTGARPFIDTFLGYNLFWFYPIVWLFLITGPNFFVIRIFFFVLSGVTGLLGYRVVQKITGQPLLSLLAATIIILIPGMQFRTYMGLLGVGNLLFLLEAFTFEKSLKSRFLWLIGSGLFLGLTFLVRIDLGILFSALVTGCILLYPLINLADWKKRCRFSALALVAYPLVVTIVHVPVDWYAARHGFRKEFWAQYTLWKGDIANYLAMGYYNYSARTLAVLAPAKILELSPNMPESLAQKSSQGDPEINKDRRTRPRPPVSDIWLAPTTGNKHFAFLVYCPLLGSGIILLLATLLLLKDWRTNDSEKGKDAFILLISLGSALTLFPQYFLFRPDPPHVSEMMCVFVITSAVAYGIAWRQRSNESRLTKVIATVYMVIAAIHIALYIGYGAKRPSMGSFALKSHAEVLVHADNGVFGYVSSDRADEYNALYKTIVEHSSPKDFVICFPYQPMVNFMTNRRSYLYNLYVDNATEPANFQNDTIADIEKYKPAAILVDDVAMNQIPASRFSVWAEQVYDYIRNTYEYAGTLVNNEIYLRKKQ